MGLLREFTAGIKDKYLIFKEFVYKFLKLKVIITNQIEILK